MIRFFQTFFKLWINEQSYSLTSAFFYWKQKIKIKPGFLILNIHAAVSVQQREIFEVKQTYGREINRRVEKTDKWGRESIHKGWAWINHKWYSIIFKFLYSNSWKTKKKQPKNNRHLIQDGIFQFFISFFWTALSLRLYFWKKLFFWNIKLFFNFASFQFSLLWDGKSETYCFYFFIEKNSIPYSISSLQFPLINCWSYLYSHKNLK